ncbi:MAG: glycerophosphodiester phosphodiesterase [Treponema sp.]|jgi:glycerophosphoryl diester phosphodiesterase|nr:glycerophosphodiester phosphodiesterase [Treponema sp.]
MKVVAHRGYSGLYPENTMTAFKKAAEAGADEIELDVQLSKDGAVVVIHDESLKRVTGQTGWVRDFTLEELRGFDASVLYSGEFGFNPIPSLDEYFSWVKTTAITTNIELKNSLYYYEGLEEKTIELVRKHGLEGKVIFSSFNHASLFTCKKLAPAIPCGLLVEHADVGNAGLYAKTCGMEYYHPDITTLTRETVENCRIHGIELNVWTVNDMAGLLRLEAWNCRGVITNYPAVCKVWFTKNAKGA